MDENINNPEAQDWELSDDYYKEEDGKTELKLEDFLEEEEQGNGAESSDESEELKKTIDDVHKVLLLAGEGKNIDQIADQTGLDSQYVYNIQVCAQGFREDDEIAVAHLVRME